MNIVCMNGRLTNDPVRRTLTNGTEVTSFRIAVRRERKNAAGEYLSDFFTVQCFGSQAKFAAEHFRKGDGANVRGRMQNTSYTDKEGIKHEGSEIIADGISFPVGAKQNAPAPAEPVPDGFSEVTVGDGDLPF